MNRHAMNFGAVMGLLFSLNFLVTTVKSIAFLQYLFVIVIIYCAYRFVVHCRENVMNGAISYGSALWYNMQLFMYGAMISALVRYVFYSYIKPDFLQNQLNETLMALQGTPMADMISGEVYQQTVEMMTPLNMALQAIWLNLMLGLLLGLILAAIVKRSENPFADKIEE
ncbi:MAG: DUF4199 domain-containing protein [Paludibacteraceae bacterium]|nr:DUF4199 domain-containing protein [Paludibacteraceae bacterium]